MGKVTDLTGKTFDRLKVIRRVPRPPYNTNHDSWWECECRCGATVQVPRSSLRRGATRSCGCLSKELSGARLAEYNRAHAKKKGETHE